MSKQLTPEFWRDGDRYVALTGECPKSFGGGVFIAFTGADSGAMSETCVHLNQLQKMKRIEVSDVPDEWSDAFSAAGFKMPEPELVSVNEEELLSNVALGLDPITAAVASTHVERNEHPRPDSRGLTFFWFCVWFWVWFCVIVGLSFKDWAGL